jgi:hypothetical protein
MPFPFQTVRAGQRPLNPSASRHNRLQNVARDHSLGGQIAPPSAVVPPGRGGNQDKYAVMVADWVSPENLVEVQPVYSALDTTPTGEPNVQIYLFLPIDHQPRGLDLPEGTLLAYHLFPDAAGATEEQGVGFVISAIPLRYGACASIITP